MGLKHFNGKVDSEYLRQSAKLAEKIKETSYEMMRLKSGMKVLDIGCGSGIDARRISGLGIRSLSAIGSCVACRECPERLAKLRKGRIKL